MKSTLRFLFLLHFKFQRLSKWKNCESYCLKVCAKFYHFEDDESMIKSVTNYWLSIHVVCLIAPSHKSPEWAKIVTWELGLIQYKIYHRIIIDWGNFYPEFLSSFLRKLSKTFSKWRKCNFEPSCGERKIVKWVVRILILYKISYAINFALKYFYCN